jgi:hypothetical protein
MRLCLALGCTLGELGQRMTAQEFGLWAAFYGMEPFGEARADLRSAIVAATVANYAGRVRSQSAGAAQPSEFMPLLRSEVEPKPTEAPDPVAYFTALSKG